MRIIQPKFLLLYLFVSGIILGGSFAAFNRPAKEEMRPACGFAVSLNGQRISWHTSAPIALVMHDSLDSDFRDALAKAVATWNQAFGRQIFFIQDGVVSSDPETSFENIVWLKKDNWRDGAVAQRTGQTEQAITNLSNAPENEAQIRVAQIVINGQASFFKDQPTGEKQSHMESILIHELGHVLGLAHTENTIMQETLSPGQIRAVIDPQTIDNVNCEYSLSHPES